MGSCFTLPEVQMPPIAVDDIDIPLPDFRQCWKQDICSVWKRSLTALAVHTDVPRLSKKITIEKNGEVLYNGTDEKYTDYTNASMTKILMETISFALNDKQTEVVLQESYDTFVFESGDTGEQLFGFFTHLKKFHGETLSVLVLKAIQQKIIFPAFYCMKEFLEPVMGPFKDLRGTWIVTLEFKDDLVIVGHTKQQESINTIEDLPQYEFTWQLIIPIHIPNQSIISDELKINLLSIKEDYFQRITKNRILMILYFIMLMSIE